MPPPTIAPNAARTVLRHTRNGRYRSARHQLLAVDAYQARDATIALILAAVANERPDPHAADRALDAAGRHELPGWMAGLVTDEIRAVCAARTPADHSPERIIARIVAADLVAEHTVDVDTWRGAVVDLTRLAPTHDERDTGTAPADGTPSPQRRGLISRR